MHVALCFLVAAAVLVSAASSRAPLSVEDMILRDQHRRNDELVRREAEYHKELHTRGDKMAASLRQPRGAYQDTPTNPDDREALEAFYHSTGGPKWANNTGWLKGDPCTYPFWYGLYCINGRVLQINMVYNNLDGPLPTSISKMTALQVIRLYSNMLTGEIPETLFTMQSLQIVDFNSNSLTGVFPSTIRMANLTQLILYANNFKGEFPSFDSPKLQLLEVSSNAFSGNLPEGIARATSLTEIVVSRNMFTGVLPSSYGALTNLQKLWTFMNNFDRSPIPESYKQLVNLQDVQADGLNGEIPMWLGSWTKLQYLVLVDGWLTGGFPESLCNCRDMLSLRLFNNSLTGTLPSCFCDMDKMVDFEVSDNQFSGELPNQFRGCRSMENFYVSRNNITGQFPSTIGYPVNMTVIDISSNAFYGTIPNTIENLQETIADFAICYNMFSDVESGVSRFFDRIRDYSCLFYNNPWSCPLSTQVPKECTATCSNCNTPTNRGACGACVKVSGCGWCDLGQNCLMGDNRGPDSAYKCKMQDWKAGAGSC